MSSGNNGGGRPRSARVKVARTLQGIRRGMAEMLTLWAEPAREMVNGRSVVARPAWQPENRPECWESLEVQMRELSLLAGEIADWAKNRRAELGVIANVAV